MALSATCLWASLNDVKPWLKMAATDVASDTVLTQIAESVTHELELLTHRIYVTRALSETLDSAGAQIFALKGYPVTSPLTTFTIDGTAVETTAYALDTAGGIITLLGGARSSTTGTGNVVIAYTAGYARASVPAHVIQVGLEMVGHRFGEWAAGANGAQQVQFGGTTFTPRSSWPYHIKDAIDALRVEVRGATLA